MADESYPERLAEVDRTTEFMMRQSYRAEANAMYIRDCVGNISFAGLRKDIDKVGMLRNPTNEKDIGEESPLLKLFSMPDIREIFVGYYEKSRNGKVTAVHGEGFNPLTGDLVQMGRGCLLNKTDIALLCCASDRVLRSLKSGEKPFFVLPRLHTMDLRSEKVLEMSWLLMKGTSDYQSLKKASEKMKFLLEVLNALDRNPYNKNLFDWLREKEGVNHSTRAQRLAMQISQQEAMMAMLGISFGSRAMYMPDFHGIEHGFCEESLKMLDDEDTDTEEEDEDTDDDAEEDVDDDDDKEIEKNRKLFETIPVLTPEQIVDTLSDQIKSPYKGESEETLQLHDPITTGEEEKERERERQT